MSRQTTAPSRALVIISTMVVALVLLLASSVQAGGTDPVIATTTEHRVHSGDTLWEIAAEHTAPGRDVRDTVAVIRRLNQIEGSLILPGSVLEVPSSG